MYLGDYFLVGIGGFIGSSFRYLISNIKISDSFPINTLIINFVGSVLIGFVSSIKLDSKVILLLKTGICGGFTTFSTFSLETFNIIRSGKIFLSLFYLIVSISSCIVGVFIGTLISKYIHISM